MIPVGGILFSTASFLFIFWTINMPSSALQSAQASSIGIKVCCAQPQKKKPWIKGGWLEINPPVDSPGTARDKSSQC